jgi:hypothetical protein
MANMLASTSLTQLASVFNHVDTLALRGQTGLPMLLFRAKEPEPWGIGQKRTIPADGGRWIVDLATFMWGYICFPARDKAKPIERMVPINKPKPPVAQLPDVGGEWPEHWSVNLACVSGPDEGVKVVCKGSTNGGLQAITGLFNTIRDRINTINTGEHDLIVPILLLEQDSYQHPQYGRTVIPLLTIIGWTLRPEAGIAATAVSVATSVATSVAARSITSNSR